MTIHRYGEILITTIYLVRYEGELVDVYASAALALEACVRLGPGGTIEYEVHDHLSDKILRTAHCYP